MLSLYFSSPLEETMPGTTCAGYISRRLSDPRRACKLLLGLSLLGAPICLPPSLFKRSQEFQFLLGRSHLGGDQARRGRAGLCRPAAFRKARVLPQPYHSSQEQPAALT